MSYTRTVRDNKKWSRVKMGEFLGVSPRTVEGYELGRNEPLHIINMLKKVRLDYREK